LYGVAARAHQTRAVRHIEARDGCRGVAFSLAPPGSLRALTALQTDLIEWRGIPLHRAWFPGEELLADLRGQGPLRITGYGCGGAMAQVAALRLHFEFGCVVEEVVTFGQPMPGRTPFKEIYEAELGAVTVRYVNGRDPAPYLPPWFSILHFTDFHAGAARVLGEFAGPQPLMWTEEMVREFGQVWAGGWVSERYPFLNDHALSSYGAGL
jgi:hypothetical protein